MSGVVASSAYSCLAARNRSERSPTTRSSLARSHSTDREICTPRIGETILSQCSPFCGSVTVYVAGSANLLRTIGAFEPTALLFDSTGNLYVANSYVSNVSVYPPGRSRPMRTITAGIGNPQGLAFDTSGNLYVANEAGSVTVYAPKGAKPIRTIRDRVVSPQALAFEGEGNLYVANSSPENCVTVYGPGQVSLLRSICKGVATPRSLALDASDNLYVANLGPGKGGCVSVFAPLAGEPNRMITDGIHGPFALAFAP